MSLEEMVAGFHTALDDEIREARQGKGQRFNLHDGRRLAASHGSFLYQFLADFEVFVPDDSPIEVRVGEQAVRGSLISVEGQLVFLEIEEDLGEEVARAELRSEPWYLLEELKARLNDIVAPGTTRNGSLALKVLGRETPSVGCEEATAKAVLEGVPRPGNPAQMRAVATALASEVVFVWGPPGTGKTSTLGLIGRALHAAGDTLLVTSHSNAAVDMAIKSLAQTMAGTRALADGKVVRVGTPRLPDVRTLDLVIPRQILKRRYPALIQKIEQAEAERQRIADRLRRASLGPERERLQVELRAIRERLAGLRQEFREREAELIRRADIVACTLSKAAISTDIYQRNFSAVAIDEASMAYVPQVCFAATLATLRCIVLGDFRQLPPVALADTEAARTWLQRDVFDHAGIIEHVERGRQDPRLCLLDTQYRMHPRISAVVNQVAYGGRLKDDPQVEARTKPIADRGPYGGAPLVLCDIGGLLPQAYREPWGQGFSHFSPFSAAVAVELVHRALEAGTQEVGVISPYATQAKLIRRLAHELQVADRVYPATVHRFQGWEREVVLFDVVDSAPLRQPGIMLRGGMRDDALRLLNVAMSRAQGKLILLGDLGFLTSRCAPASAFTAFLREVTARGVREPVRPDFLRDRLVGEGSSERGIRWCREPRDALRTAHTDIQNARKEVLINWPDRDLEDLLPDEVIRPVRQRDVRVVVSAPDLPVFQVIATRYSLELVPGTLAREAWMMIDREIFWVLGWIGGFNRTRPSLRIALRGVANLLGEITGLQKLAAGREPVDPAEGLGKCACGGVLWIENGKYGVYGRCQSCRQTRRLQQDHATRFAGIAGIRCDRCHGEAVGRQGPQGVFLGCRRYPACSWTANLAKYA